VDGIDSGSCPRVGFNVGRVEPLGSATRELLSYTRLNPFKP
jgi:hypothetical protein